MSTKKILMVLTSHAKLGDSGHKTGFWLEEFAAPYYVFLDAGADITLASPKGGMPPVDPNSELTDAQTPATERYDADKNLQQQLAQTRVLADVLVDDFDAVFYPGGHGPLWDLTDDQHSIALIQQFMQQQKPVAAVCHAPAVLLNAVDENHQSIVKARAVTGFSNSEEAAVGLTEVVPFLLEDSLIAKGGDYQRGDDWAVFVVQDGLLITGQNPASSEETAQKLLHSLSA